MTSFHGVWPALLTPLTADDEIDIPALRRLLDYVLGAGVHGIYVCGSTGEGVLLSLAERMHMAEATVSHVAGDVPVMVHVGAASTRDAVALARHAHQVGVGIVGSVLYVHLLPCYAVIQGFLHLCEGYRRSASDAFEFTVPVPISLSTLS